LGLVGSQDILTESLYKGFVFPRKDGDVRKNAVGDGVHTGFLFALD
jgi:hypothetical protein